MKINHSIIGLFLSLSLSAIHSGCDVILPPPPPFEPTQLMPDAYAWAAFDILEEYEYMHLSQLVCKDNYPVLSCTGLTRRRGARPNATAGAVPRMDPWLRKACPRIRTAAIALGVCHPAYTDTARLECPKLSDLLTSLHLCESVETDTTRINCPKVGSVLTDSGVCKPVNTARGQLIRCPLAAPFETLEFGCLTADETPAVYVRFTTLPSAESVPVPSVLGTCQPESAGPIVGDAPRYKTDDGYKVCLLSGNEHLPAGALSTDDRDARPVGLYLDYSGSAIAPEAIEKMAQKNAFSGRFSLVLDTVYFNAEDRKRAFEALRDVFTIYRQFAPAKEETTEEVALSE